MQLTPRTEHFGVEDQRWLGSAHATDAAQTITLDNTKLSGVIKDDTIPSGIPLKAGDNGKYEPVTDAGDTLAGFLLTSQSFKAGTDVVAPMLDHGRIKLANLPAAAFDVSTLTTQPDRFVFVKKGA